MLGPARKFSLQNVKLSRIVFYRSKILRMKCSLNWSYINCGEDRFRSYSGTRQLLLFGVTEWCLCRQCLQVLYQCLTECWIENSVLWLAQWNWPISIWFVDPDVGCVSLHVYFSVFWPCEYSVLWLRSVSRFLHGLVGISLKEMV